MTEFQYDHSANITSNRELHFRKRFIPEYRLLYFRSGKGAFQFSQSELIPEKETMYLFAPGERENNYCADQPVSFLYISFHTSRNLTNSDYLSCQPFGPYRNAMTSLIELIHSEQDPIRQSLLDTLLTLFLSQCSHHSEQLEPRLQNSINFISQNIHLNLNIPTLADQANLSCSHFRKLFKEETGTSPKEYITKKRMEYALDLIRHNNMRIYEVANLLHFPNIFQFSNQYKKHFGHSPKNDLSKFQK